MFGKPAPAEPTAWTDVRWHQLLEDTGSASGLLALCDLLQVKLEQRWEPGKGVVWRAAPK